MNKRSLTTGIVVTVIWIAIIVCIYLFTGLEHPKSLNEFGDFLAGVFAPVAFFWLILGYMQQGKQLDQNTKALEQQERALQLQIHGMKESVQQQKELAEPIAVEVKALQNFYTAEEYHQDYLDKNPNGYCHLPLALFEFARKAKDNRTE